MNRDLLRLIYSRWWQSVALAAALTAVTGCIVLPVPVNYHTHGSRKNLRSEDAQWLVRGQTTRKQVVLRLGEPDEIEDDGSSVVYRWEKIYLQVWIVFWSAGGRDDFGRDYALELAFDLHGTLTKHALLKSGFKIKPPSSLVVTNK